MYRCRPRGGSRPRAPGRRCPRVAVTGGSQGGGIALAVGGLQPDVAAALPDVPFLCHYRRATQIVDTLPYGEISRYCQTHRDKIETVFHTLSYFDGVNLRHARQCAGAVFGRADGHDLPAVHRLRRLQPLRRHQRAESLANTTTTRAAAATK